MQDDYSITYGNAPPTKRVLNDGLQGTAAFAIGKAWGQRCKAKYTTEEIAAFLRMLGEPRNDHDKGVVEGLTNG